MNNNIIPMGYITGAFGILGFVRIKPSTSNVDALGKYKALQVLINNKWESFQIEKYSVFNEYIQIKFIGINDRDKASKFRGATVGVWRSELPEPKPDEFYFVDLLDLTVINTKNDVIGTVTDVFETGANAVIVTKNIKHEYLIPFVKSYILEVDFIKKVIIVDWELDF